MLAFLSHDVIKVQYYGNPYIATLLNLPKGAFQNNNYIVITYNYRNYLKYEELKNN